MPEPVGQPSPGGVPVRLSVSDVRRAIYAASGFASGGGQASTDLLGSIFHRAFRMLLDPSSEHRWSNLLDEDSLGDHGRLRNHVYQSLIGPALRKHANVLSSSSAEALAMWDATEHMCQKVCQLLLNSREQGLLQFDFEKAEWAGASQFVPEHELSWVVREPGWTAPVRVSGIADAVWQHPVTKRWCVLELKLGAGAAEADLAQLCLYHEMLRQSPGGLAGQIALWHFQPDLKVGTFSEAQIEPVKPALRALIGRLAGVSRSGLGHNPQPGAIPSDYSELGARLVKVLEQFGPFVTLDSDPVVGSAFLRFHIKPGPGVKVNRILRLGEDLGVQLRLRKPAMIRLEDGSLVVDLERPDRETLFFSEFRDRLPRGENGNSKLLVGIDLNREARFADLSSDCPHILAAGTTGSGKSEWLLTAMASLIATNHPSTLRLLLIDPKRVTFRDIRDSPFRLYDQDVLVTPEEAVSGFDLLIEEMERRYQLFAKHGANDLNALRALLPDVELPRIVCFCDEYGNLAANKRHRESVEQRICQIGAKARAAGIHLIVATQDPRAEILSPALKSNLDGRVCLRTASPMQSRMILNETGGEALLGHGDLLFRGIGQQIRLQAPLLTDQDRLGLFGAVP